MFTFSKQTTLGSYSIVHNVTGNVVTIKLVHLPLYIVHFFPARR